MKAEEKQALRRRLKALRAGIPNKDALDLRICEHICAFVEEKGAAHVMLYHAIGSEPNLQAAMERLWGRGIKLYLPRVCHGQMHAVLCGRETPLAQGEFGVMEPVGPAAGKEQIQIVFCPGLGFSSAGVRLGYGGGFFDRFLEKMDAIPVGVCYTESILGEIVADCWDHPMQAIITPGGVNVVSKAVVKDA